jgi:hypothetical protein
MEIEGDGLEDEDVLMVFVLVHQMASFFLMNRGRLCYWRVIFLFFNGPEELFYLFSELPSEPVNES